MREKGSWRFLMKIAASAAVVCLVALFFFRTSLFTGAAGRILHILEPFLYGAVIAWLLRPVCVRTERILCRLTGRSDADRRSGSLRMISVFVSLLLLFAVLALALLMILPELVSSISGLVSQLPGAIQSFQSWLNGLQQEGLPEEMVGDVQLLVSTVYEKLQGFLQTDLLPWLQTVAGNMLSSFRGLLTVLKNFGLGCIVAAYLLGSWERFCSQLQLINYALLPEKYADWLTREVRFTDEKFSGFIIGKLIDSLIIGLICFAFVSLTGMPYAMLVSLIVGLTNIIPFFGPYMGAIPSAILILTVSPVKCLVFLVFIIILQQLDGNVIGPMILGDRLGLSGFWILFSILVFGSLWGIAGMLVGAPVFAVVYDLVRRAVRRGLDSRGQGQRKAAYDSLYAEPEPSQDGRKSFAEKWKGRIPGKKKS